MRWTERIIKSNVFVYESPSRLATERVTTTVSGVTLTGTLPARTFSPWSRLFRKSVLGSVVMLLIWSSALFRYGTKSMLKGRPAITVWTGGAPDPDGDGLGLGTIEAEAPDPEGGSAFDVGMTGCDASDVPASLDGGERGGRDSEAVE